MGQTNCRWREKETELPIFYGHDLGKTAWLPSKGYMVMRKWSPKYIHLVGKNGAIFQFRLEYFHCWESMLLTSTLHDTFWFFYPHLSFENTMYRARKGQERYPSKTSKSGYVCWGEYFEKQYVDVVKHLEEEEIELDLEWIGSELKRRKKLNEV